MDEAGSQSTQSKRTLDDDVARSKPPNAQINQTNERVLPLLETLTGQKFGADPEPWRKWWADQLGLVLRDRYHRASRPTAIPWKNRSPP